MAQHQALKPYMKQLENQEQQESTDTANSEVAGADPQQPSSRRRYLLPIFLFLIIIAAGIAAGFLGWQQFLQYQQQNQAVISELRAQLAALPTRSELDTSLRPLQQAKGKTDQEISELTQRQQSLLASTEKLYELYGRDENGWKLAEVEYLMSIAQHKLILEQDFEGAAKTLDAASSRIAELADPGLLPVRVQINDEIAALKTRARPDLVGMTLLAARLSRQINSLTPEYVARANAPKTRPSTQAKATDDPSLPLDQRVMNFLGSLVTIKKKDSSESDQSDVTHIIDVRQKLEDNLKLTRWSVLERDANQFNKLMTENVQLFSDYYDLENSVNSDFYDSLLRLQKSSLKPVFPDISGSLRLLKEIQQKRATAPQQEADNG
jgi:uncharacterized protein HemX